MLATEIFVSVMVIDALISMQTSIASGSGLAHVRLGTGGSRFNQESGSLEFGNCLCGTAIIAMTCFTCRQNCLTHMNKSHKFSIG